MNMVYTSSRMETLLGKLAGNLNRQSGSIFSKTMIITQGGGMNDWLSRNITETNGVFAHYQFTNQDGFLGQVYELLFEEKPGNNRDTVQFAVYALLDTIGFKEAFPGVASYYEGHEVRRIQLATRVADLFDQYQMYREDIIEKWANGVSSIENPAEAWQQWLWKELNLEPKSALKKKILGKLKEDPKKLPQTWPEIHLFGISVYTRFHLDFYISLADYTDVCFYVCLPTPEKQYQHELLQSYGSKAIELEGFFSDMAPEKMEASEPIPNTRLGRLQASIRNNKELVGGDSDGSIQVTSHFTPVREVEALYNYLLNLFDEDRTEKKLKPGDILVVTPDIEKYEPFIKAVFRNAPVKLPIQVSGAPANLGDTMTAALELLMAQQEGDLTAESVMGLLEQNRIRKRFRVEDTSYVRAVVNKAGIRFGLINSFEDDTHYVSWKYGLEKIILGYAMLTDEEFGENYPYKDAEASASHDLLRLKAFVDALEKMFGKQSELHTLQEWKRWFLEEMLEGMVFCDDFEKRDREEKSAVYRSLRFTDELTDELKVPYGVFLHELKQRLFTESFEHNLSSGRITFAPAMPVRGLPYKVIAFIGLDNGVFPRQDSFYGFDLLGDEYRQGDRSKKENDKFLFLEILMAAREKLYLSYIGQSVKDNTEIPPSIVLDTLMDYLGLQPVKHPLHGFSNRYDNDVLFTYLYNTEPDPNVHKKKEPDNDSGDMPEVISVRDFVKFFEAPIDWYFKKVLGINYNGDEDDTLPETELFELNPLQKWEIKKELLTMNDTSSAALDVFIQRLIRQGKLPLKNLGRATVEEMLEEIKPVRDKYIELTNGQKEKSVSIDLDLNGFRITGTIDRIFNKQYIHVSTSTSDNIDKYKVRAYLHALLLYAAGEINSAWLLVAKKSSGDIRPIDKQYQMEEQENAMQKLSELAEYIKKGKQQPLIFSLNASKLPKKDEPITIKSVFDALKKETEDKTYDDPPIPGNKYIRKLMDEGCFNSLTEKNLQEIRNLAGLLNLYA